MTPLKNTPYKTFLRHDETCNFTDQAASSGTQTRLLVPDESTSRGFILAVALGVGVGVAAMPNWAEGGGLAGTGAASLRVTGAASLERHEGGRNTAGTWS